jgi:hypothetical protein
MSWQRVNAGIDSSKFDDHTKYTVTLPKGFTLAAFHSETKKESTMQYKIQTVENGFVVQVGVNLTLDYSPKTYVATTPEELAKLIKKLVTDEEKQTKEKASK